jgi:hypothetical protein
MTHETTDWLNRTGMLLGFLSFWFVTPEFVGEARLKQWEDALGKGLLKLPLAAKAVMMSVTLIFASLFLYHWETSERVDSISSWKLCVMGIVSSTAIYLSIIEPQIEKVVSKLANDGRVRQRFLFLGAAFFILSTLLQFIATF